MGREYGMDFSRVDLDDDDLAFQSDVRATLAELVTDEVKVRNRLTGDNLDINVHRALGERGWLFGQAYPPDDGGFSPLRQRIYELETHRAEMPYFHWGITLMIVRQVMSFASDSLKAEVLPAVMTGEVRMSLGYTEPDGGSDVATCKTRAVRDGDDWIINGSKMFTTGAHNAGYVFLVTNTNPQAPKHKNLTMFLVPLNSAGIEIQGLRTVDGDRTNIVYYSDVRVSDHYRIGEIDGGWSVLRAALDDEHSFEQADPHVVGLKSVAAMAEHGELVADAIERLATAPTDEWTGHRLIDDPVTKYRLGRGYSRIEAALSTPAHYGRVAVAYALRDLTPELMDIAGAAGALSVDTDGAVEGGAAEHLYRLSLPTGIYGGTTEVYLNMIAEHSLGLGRPAYARAAQQN